MLSPENRALQLNRIEGVPTSSSPRKQGGEVTKASSEPSKKPTSGFNEYEHKSNPNDQKGNEASASKGKRKLSDDNDDEEEDENAKLKRKSHDAELDENLRIAREAETQEKAAREAQ
ncbi:unnamed protein product [Lactuca saligna]|uniref:Uncharacterized protein n=1 Tax=Lactuca saligna TaxID=75948 RepID=A0AA36A4B3_LACSI|nr:unnamed protein product [Lactuca saligna]